MKRLTPPTIAPAPVVPDSRRALQQRIEALEAENARLSYALAWIATRGPNQAQRSFKFGWYAWQCCQLAARALLGLPPQKYVIDDMAGISRITVEEALGWLPKKIREEEGG